MSVPAAARMEASGVLRSCETESSSADLSASLRRETSAVMASRCSRARWIAPPIWSAAAARTCVSPRSGSPSSRGRSTQITPSGSLSTVMATRYAVSLRSRAAVLATGPGVWTRTHSAGSSPGRRRRTTCTGGATGGDAVSAVSAATVSPTLIQTRVARVCDRRISAIGPDAETGSRWPASVKLMLNIASASRSTLEGGDRPFAFTSSQTTDHDADDQQEEQVQPFRWVPNREGVQRLGEEEVVGQERPDSRCDRRSGAARDRDRDDREQEGGGAVSKPTTRSSVATTIAPKARAASTASKSGTYLRARRSTRRPTRRSRRLDRPAPSPAGGTAGAGAAGGDGRPCGAGHRPPPRTIRRASRVARRNCVRWCRGRMWLGSPS